MLDESSKDLLLSKLTTVIFENDMPKISAAIWHWIRCHSALPQTNKREKWQNLNQKKFLSGEKEF